MQPVDPLNSLARRSRDDAHAEACLTSDPRTALHRIVINIIDACNRACSFCPKADPVGFPNRVTAKMSLEDATRLGATAAAMGFRGVFSITGWGEPLLHTGAAALISGMTAGNPQASIELQTNGDPLTAGRIRALADAGLTRLVINLYDGADQAERFQALLADAGVSKGFVVLQHKYGGRGIILNNRAGTFHSSQDGIAPLTAPLRQPCYMPFYKIAVDWNLDTFFCDYDWSRRILLGSLRREELSDLWLSPTMRRIREDLFEGRRETAPCRACDAAGTLYGRKQADVLMNYYRHVDQRSS